MASQGPGARPGGRRRSPGGRSRTRTAGRSRSRGAAAWPSSRGSRRRAGPARPLPRPASGSFSASPPVQALGLLDEFLATGSARRSRTLFVSRPADQELRRDSAPAWGRPVVGLVGLQPALREQVAEAPASASKRWRGSELSAAHVVEREVRRTGRTHRRPAECNRPAFVSIDEGLRCRCGPAGGRLPLRLGDGRAMRLHAMGSFCRTKVLRSRPAAATAGRLAPAVTA